MQASVHTSIFLARLLGPLFLVVGAGMLLNPKVFRAMAEDVIKSITLLYLFGLVDFAIGLAIVLTHNVWLVSWRVLVTLIGWLLLIRGAVRILIPDRVMGYAAKVLRAKSAPLVSGAIIVLLGLVFCYYSFVRA